MHCHPLFTTQWGHTFHCLCKQTVFDPFRLTPDYFPTPGRKAKCIFRHMHHSMIICTCFFLLRVSRSRCQRASLTYKMCSKCFIRPFICALVSWFGVIPFQRSQLKMYISIPIFSIKIYTSWIDPKYDLNLSRSVYNRRYCSTISSNCSLVSLLWPHCFSLSHWCLLGLCFRFHPDRLRCRTHYTTVSHHTQFPNSFVILNASKWVWGKNKRL
jgi:hypothetical protein